MKKIQKPNTKWFKSIFKSGQFWGSVAYGAVLGGIASLVGILTGASSAIVDVDDNTTVAQHTHNPRRNPGDNIYDVASFAMDSIAAANDGLREGRDPMEVADMLSDTIETLGFTPTKEGDFVK